MVVITQPNDGVFRLHLPAGPTDYSDQASAISAGRTAAHELAETRAQAAGAEHITCTVSHSIKQVDLGNNKSLFVEAQIQAEASGL